MLQQTQVAAVMPYYQRFMSRFPDVDALAAASIDEVLHVWAGLGYYARARNLHRAARLVIEHHQGCLPDDIGNLQTLPGIGRSTAGAILALSSGQRHPILDGNARRVLARVFAIEGGPGDANTLRRLWALADACTPHERVAEYTQAIMDLGATVCLRAHPVCDACPLSDTCIANKTNRQHELPSPRHRAARPRRTAYALVIREAHGHLLVQKRPTNGLWGGLWTLPQFDTEPEALAWLTAHLPTATNLHRLEAQHHTFTHYDLRLNLYAAQADTRRTQLQGCAWYDPREAPLLGLTKAVTNLGHVL
jgi:A/G-specific adenine glycosylase